MAFSLPVLGYYIKKGLQKGGSRTPQDPPDCALVDDLKKNSFKSLFCLSAKALGVQGYYIPARGYEFYLRVVNSITHE